MNRLYCIVHILIPILNIFFVDVSTYISEQERHRLENDPLCGLTTGGSEECWWRCNIQRVEHPLRPGIFLKLILNPSCLSECYPADHCLSSLLADYQAAGGICQGSWLDLNYPGLLPVSNQACELFTPGDCDCTFEDYLNFVCTEEETLAADCWWWEYYGFPVARGLCSDRTQQLLRDQERCIHPIWSEKLSITHTTHDLIRSLCDYQTWLDWKPAPVDTKRSGYSDRLIPISSIQANIGVTLARVPPLEHTKHHYPWLCSLRSVGRQSSHLCAVTLLSRPPGPTVLVTSAHCTYICKSEEGRIVPNCCCPNVGPGLCTDTQDCGTNATTVLMTGEEAEVKCGEWDTATDIEEDYNVILPIEKITVHPDFNISRGEQNSQFVVADIATIHVSDDNFEQQSRTHKIFPACLPSNNHLSTTAIHSGWSKPPPLAYIKANVPLYEEFYGDFFKQWHHSLKIKKCEDPPTNFWTGAPLKYPTNSFYPPGTVCAVEREAEFCPTGGESGSPLMVTDDEGRMIAEGINSFIKVSNI